MMRFFFFVIALVLSAGALAGPAEEFKSIVQTVLDEASSIESQRAVLESAVATQVSKSLYWTPTASVVVTNDISQAIMADTMGNGTIASAKVNVFQFGSNDLGRRAANSKVSAESARLGQTKEDLETLVANFIFQLIQQRKLVDIQNSHVKVQAQLLNVAKERYKQGQLAEQEYDKAKVDYETAQINFTDAELNEVQTLNLIKALADINPLIHEWPLANSGSNFGIRARKTATDFYTVKANLADSDYFHKNAQQLWRSSYLPSLDLSAGWQDFGYAPVQQGQWFAGLTFTVPLWDQLQGSARVQDFESSSRAAAANSRQSLRQAQASLESLDRRLELAQENLKHSKQSAAKLAQLRNDSLKRFRLGRFSVNDLLIDENRYLDAENSVLTSSLSYLRLVVEACHAQNESIVNCF